ncbi:MAG: TROVE domain-containing protein [Hyphomonadaceae bacterium]
MVKINKPVIPRTHEGAKARAFTPAQQLRRALMNCLLWEDQFYEDGVAIAERVGALVPKVEAETVAAMAIEAREDMKLRHAPLLVVREMARHESHRGLVADTLERVIQRPDELTEFLAIYWADALGPMQQRKTRAVSAQAKKGLARAFAKFDAYQLAKYDRDGAVRLRDVLFITHAKPKDAAQEQVWKQLIDGTLNAPDTWEVALSAGKDKKATFERLLRENRLGYLALLRNLRNMESAKVDPALVEDAILTRRGAERVLPFRYVAAARAAPGYEAALEKALLADLARRPKLAGKTLIVVDVSGSMYGSYMSKQSETNRATAAASLAAILRELCEEVRIYATAGNDSTRVHATKLAPPRRGMALVDAIYGQCQPLGGGGIFLKQVMDYLKKEEGRADRIVVVTDEQDCGVGSEDSPQNAKPFGRYNYMLNVASYQNGIGSGVWTRVNGFSERVIDWIAAMERAE